MKPENLTEYNIKNFADSNGIFMRGKDYHRQGKIKYIDVREGGKTIFAKVEGSYDIERYSRKMYDVRINLDGKGGIRAECTCPYGSARCKHVVAVLLKFLYEYKGKKIVDSEKDFKAKVSDMTLDDVIRQTSKDSIFGAFDILAKKNLKIKSLTNDEMITEIDEKVKQYSFWQGASTRNVKVEIYLRNFSYTRSFYATCNCSPYGNSKCAHVAASLLALLMQKNKREISDVKEEFVSKVRAEQFNNFINELDSLSLEKQSVLPVKNYILYFNAEKGYDNNLNLSIEKRRILKSGIPGAPSTATIKFIKENYDSIQDNRRKIFDLFMWNLKQEYRWVGTSEKLVKRIFLERSDSVLLRGMKNLYLTDPHAFQNCIFPAEKGEIEINISEDEKRKKAVLKLTANVGEQNFCINKENVAFLGEHPLWASIFDREKNAFVLFELECTHQKIVSKLAEFSNAEMESSHLKNFIEKYYLKLSAIGKVTLPECCGVEEQKFTPVPRLFLMDYGKAFGIEMRFLYDKHEISYNSRQDIVFKNKEERIIKIVRDKEKENMYFKTLIDHHTADNGDCFIPTIDPYLWLADVANDLVAIGYEIYGRSELLNNKIALEDPKLRLEVSSGIDWFDLKGEASFGKESVSLDKIISSVSQCERFIKLSDGRMGVIPKKWLDKLSGIAGLMQRHKKIGNVKASISQVAIVELLLDISENSSVDKKFKEIKEKFSRFKKIKNIPLPKKLKGELRDYQKAGYDWLHFLKEFNFGGCLADEMGLGKTVQVLSLLLYEKENGSKAPSLVVVPTSLVFNWVNEINKFTPSFNIYVHHGFERERDGGKIWQKNVDIILTTYGTLRNDVSIFKDKEFNYIILDESQHIKNPFSKIAKEIYPLKSVHKLAMTGTPIENNSLELWSQFAFLNPGLLGNIDYFKDTFAKSIEKEKDEYKTNALKNIINPFLLRRKKDMVAKDLPEKQISISYCEMEPKQREIYDAWKSKIKNEIETSIKENGFMKSRMKILQGLMKLRQICNHPLLINESFTGESGKLNMLMDQIEEVISNGHKALVFSSFVKMLHLFRDEFERKGIKFSYLDGGTRNRKDIVEQFQSNSDILVFLISLKAGGLGLNLTAAEYVFIVDPWWNPAAEMQAMDRTHRIGQEKKIFVYKAITKDSIEEKILQLQESKMDLVNNVIAIDSGLFKKLNKGDIGKLFV